MTYLAEHRKSNTFKFNQYYTVQLYVPPSATVNRDFLRQVLKGEKKLLKMSEAKFVTVPKYDEISVKQVYPKFINDSNVT